MLGLHEVLDLRPDLLGEAVVLDLGHNALVGVREAVGHQEHRDARQPECTRVPSSCDAHAVVQRFPWGLVGDPVLVLRGRARLPVIAARDLLLSRQLRPFSNSEFFEAHDYFDQ